jgi:hypothetical protein
MQDLKSLDSTIVSVGNGYDSAVRSEMGCLLAKSLVDVD